MTTKIWIILKTKEICSRGSVNGNITPMCSFPSALEELKYKMPGGYEFVSSQVRVEYNRVRLQYRGCSPPS